MNADFIVKMADCEPEHAEQTRLLGISAKLGSDIARTRLLDDSAKGNLLAAAIALEVGALTAETAEIVLQELMKLLQQEQSDSAKGRFGFRYSVDRCLLMAALSLSFPSIARWKEIMLYIGDSAVIADHKVASIYRIIRDLSKLPDDAKQLLQMQVPGLRVSRYRPVNLFEGWAERRSATGLADFVHFGINGQSNSGLEEFVWSCPKAWCKSPCRMG